MLPESFEVTLREVVAESPDTVTLVLDAHGHRDYRAGQYLGIGPHQFIELAELIHQLEAGKGRKEPQRKYSLASAPHETDVVLTVKGEEQVEGVTKYPPLLSNHLIRALKPGAHFTVFGYSGPYVLADAHAGLVVHVVAGSGAVPNFSIVKDALHRGLPSRHLWIASNKRREDVLYDRALTALAAQHPQQLQIVNTLTREQAAGFRHGRVDRVLFEELIPAGERETCLVFACGPAVHTWDRHAALASGTPVTPRFMETVLGELHGLGITDKRIKREVYG
jgi:3-ketosteroid 9alpha-monooxygenase subunit B